MVVLVFLLASVHHVSVLFLALQAHFSVPPEQRKNDMPLEIRKQRDGRWRDAWFGRYEVNGERFCVNLGVKIAGTPPATGSLKDQGDAAFEVSRGHAQAKLDSIVEEVKSKQHASRLVEKLYELKTGERIKAVKLAELKDEWAKIPRKRKPDERYSAQCQSLLGRFAAFVQEQNPKAGEIGQVTRTVARAFMSAEEERGVMGKTWNDTLKLLRSTFAHLLPEGAINPFSGLVTKESETIFRKPFTPGELKKILDAAEEDEFIRPIIVTGVCTAMRRGDCCLLKWKDVDLKKKFVTVKTNKTGVTVDIPIFPLLFDELNGRDSEKTGPFVFPEQAQMYQENPDGITWRVKKVLALALGNNEPDADALPEVAVEEVKRRGSGYVAGLTEGGKRERMQVVFQHYMDGKKVCEAAVAAGVSKGSVSGYLNEIEANIGCRVVRGRPSGLSLTARLKNDSGGLLTVERENGGRAASVRDFHSFRVTWVTLALTAGVPLELVQKVTGHKTVDIVLKHYFQPGREDFRRALHAAMPKLLTNGEKSPKDEMRAVIERATARTWKRDKKRLLELLAEL